MHPHLLWRMLADTTNEASRVVDRLGVELTRLWHDIHHAGDAARRRGF